MCRGGVGSTGHEVLARIHELAEYAFIFRQIMSPSHTLAGYDQVRERTGHRQAAIVHGIVEDNGKYLFLVGGAVKHAPPGVARNYDVMDLRMSEQSLLEDSHPFRAIAGARE